MSYTELSINPGGGKPFLQVSSVSNDGFHFNLVVTSVTPTKLRILADDMEAATVTPAKLRAEADLLEALQAPKVCPVMQGVLDSIRKPVPTPEPESWRVTPDMERAG